MVKYFECFLRITVVFSSGSYKRDMIILNFKKRWHILISNFLCQILHPHELLSKSFNVTVWNQIISTLMLRSNCIPITRLDFLLLEKNCIRQQTTVKCLQSIFSLPIYPEFVRLFCCANTLHTFLSVSLLLYYLMF